jgi:hypothetical protein
VSATNRTGPYQQFVLPIGNTSEIHEDLWDIDRKLNLLAEKILTIDERLDEARLDKRIRQVWTTAIVILIVVTLLPLKFIL